MPRHQTLRAALDWSYELLSSDEQRLLCHLAIFLGAFTCEAAKAVGTGYVSGDVILDLTASLVAKSLVTMEEGVSAHFWRLLETISAYALQKLAESGEYRAIARRHAEHVRAIIVSPTAVPVLRSTISFGMDASLMTSDPRWTCHFPPTVMSRLALRYSRNGRLWSRRAPKVKGRSQRWSWFQIGLEMPLSARPTILSAHSTIGRSTRRPSMARAPSSWPLVRICLARDSSPVVGAKPAMILAI